MVPRSNPGNIDAPVTALVVAMLALCFASQSALAEKRVALVIGNSNYQNVAPLRSRQRRHRRRRDVQEGVVRRGRIAPRPEIHGNAPGAARFHRQGARRGYRGDLFRRSRARGRRSQLRRAGRCHPRARRGCRRRSHLAEPDFPRGRARDQAAPDHPRRLPRQSVCEEHAAYHRVARSLGRGLAGWRRTTSNTLIAFAAKEGSTAADGDGANSPFSAALLQTSATPGLDFV